ncbi:pentatricopeptide repeat-containing protein At1g74600, chloroplastic [Rosa rugosa]|uniref:pentatricopeptide repeat-containing protein At1g74600, chloroplastic n=1 Tax=Rosa rugosa TaxID=74645 RepID=UPI002B415665|nr:pentatricopeptide repeat-containing protein At1g74600, chloroplastic [Rosa rugosa]
MIIYPKSQMLTRIGMKSLLNPKISLSTLKSISSLAAVKNPSFSPSLFDPFQFLNDYTKSTHCTITNTRILHAHSLRIDLLPSNVAIANSLLDCYCRSGSMADALHLFDVIPDRNVISWNFMVSGYNRSSMFENSWGVFCRMRCSGFEPDEFTYGSVLSACTALQASSLGEQVYSLAMKNGFFSSDYVRSGMIDLFAKSGSFEDALRVFRDVSCWNVVIWNGVISAAVRNGENGVALDLFRQMCCGFLLPNSFTFSSVLTACAALGEIGIGREVQGWVIKRGAEDVFVGTAIVDLYSKCGNMNEAVKEFSRMPTRNVVSWTAIISGFVGKGDSISGLKFFREMRRMGEEINKFTITSVLTACAKPSMSEEAIQIHSLILKSGLYSAAEVGSALINAYSKIGAVDVSEMVFREMRTLKDLGTWAAMISSFAQNQSPESAIGVFQRMLQESVRPDKFSTSSVLSIIDYLGVGRQIHSYTLKVGLAFDASVGSSLSTMYSKCDSLEESYKAFQQIRDKDNVSWASMIAGFSEHGFADQALQLYREMPYKEIIPDQMTLAAILTACSASRSLLIGKEIHGHALRAGVGRDVVVGGAIVNMYSKCSALELARRVFDMLPQKDEVACSSLVSGYAQNGCIEEALLLFHYMLMADLTIDSFTISSILGVIALLNNPSIGTQMHAHITKIGLNSDVSVGSSLVRMYSKCGSIEDCRKSFDQIENPDLICWTAMIASYAQHGKGAEALRGYELLKEEGIKPDSVTFVAVLSACSHNGLVEEAYFYFNSMAADYGLKPGYRHYACMVDVLGRSGRLKEAERFIINMPIEPNGLIWGTLLAACVMHRYVELGKLTAKKIMDLEPYDASTYVSLSNMCADLGLWEEAEQIRNQMRGNCMRKEPGWSLISVN